MYTQTTTEAILVLFDTLKQNGEKELELLANCGILAMDRAEALKSKTGLINYLKRRYWLWRMAQYDNDLEQLDEMLSVIDDAISEAREEPAELTYELLKLVQVELDGLLVGKFAISGSQLIYGLPLYWKQYREQVHELL